MNILQIKFCYSDNKKYKGQFEIYKLKILVELISKFSLCLLDGTLVNNSAWSLTVGNLSALQHKILFVVIDQY